MLNKFRFWGAVTVGTKGQVVIPIEARNALGMKEGDKMLVVSPPDSKAIIIIQPDVLEQYMQRMQTNIKDMLSTNQEEK